jgi:hypothetical protein
LTDTTTNSTDSSDTISSSLLDLMWTFAGLV